MDIETSVDGCFVEEIDRKITFKFFPDYFDLNKADIAASCESFKKYIQCRVDFDYSKIKEGLIKVQICDDGRFNKQMVETTARMIKLGVISRMMHYRIPEKS